jgi:hypothetical protein
MIQIDINILTCPPAVLPNIAEPAVTDVLKTNVTAAVAEIPCTCNATLAGI